MVQDSGPKIPGFATHQQKTISTLGFHSNQSVLRIHSNPAKLNNEPTNSKCQHILLCVCVCVRVRVGGCVCSDQFLKSLLTFVTAAS